MHEGLDCNKQKWIEMMNRALRKEEDGGRKGERVRSSSQGKMSRPNQLWEGPCRYDQEKKLIVNAEISNFASMLWYMRATQGF